MSSPTIRAALAFAALSAWLVLLMSGFALGGAIHLLLAGALALFPWRAARGEGGAELAAQDDEEGVGGVEPTPPSAPPSEARPSFPE